VAYTIFRVEVNRGPAVAGRPVEAPKVPPSPMAAQARKPDKVGAGAKTVGRNDPCPCGSGLKYKKCHGK
jgi:preprotein translocase subunit SecA